MEVSMGHKALKESSMPDGKLHSCSDTRWCCSALSINICIQPQSSSQFLSILQMAQFFLQNLRANVFSFVFMDSVNLLTFGNLAFYPLHDMLTNWLFLYDSFLGHKTLVMLISYLALDI